MSAALSIVGAPVEAARAVRSVLALGDVEPYARPLPKLLKKKERRVLFVFRDVEPTLSSTDDPAAALARWNAALETLFALAQRPRALERVFVLRYDDLVEPAPGCLDALLSFAGVPASDAVRGRLDAARRGESTSRPLSAEARDLVERHARRDLAEIARGFAAESQLCWTTEPTAAPVRELARAARASRDAVSAEAARVRALRDWRIGRLVKQRNKSRARREGLVEAAAKLNEVLKQGKAIGKALSAAEDAQHIKARLKTARARVEHSSAADRAYPWQRELGDALDRCAGVFRLPGGGGAGFARSGDELLSVDGDHGYHVRDNAVRARPEDVVLVRDLASKPDGAPAPPERLALDIGTKSGDGFVGFVEHYAREIGVDPDALDAVIGVDLNETKLAGAVDLGILPVLADGNRLPFADASFDLVVAMELLEHVPPDVALGICREIRRVSRGAVFIQNPDFSEEAYLAELGLKFSWMGWREHCHHITQDALETFLVKAGFGRDARVERVMPVADSSHPLIVPIDAPAQTLRYSRDLGYKPHVSFDRPLFEKLRVVVPRSSHR